ncbi:MAG: tetratricopeptide repeat protein [Proteobacteria bacterium]|nr:tetratricopeptide repeat protein [Pseudomonadota bacterium]
MTEFLARLKQRKLVQWALAYVAAAFALIQVIDVVASRFNWPAPLERSIILALAVGFVVTLVIAWYHGEKGRQRVSGPELLLIALVLAIGGGLLWRFGRPASPSVVVARKARSYNAAVCRSAPCARPSAEMQAGSPARRAPAVDISSLAIPIPTKSIAVLPFVNMSGDPKNDYFSDGITEEILDALAQIPNLKVAARTSAFAFKGKAEDLRKVGEVLDVATVLEGSVQKSGDEVRITAQLIDTRSGYHLWSEKYDRKLTNIFSVEDEISKAIADKLQVQLTGGSASTLVAQKTVDPHAHDFYLRGLSLLAARSVPEAVAVFKRAVAIDSGYAQAWAGLAEAQVLLPTYGPVSTQAAYSDSLQSSRRSLALNPGTALAYVAQGMVYTNQMRWADADRAFRRALILAPGDAEAMDQYAQFLFGVGQLDAGLAEIERALRRDPLSAVNSAVRAENLLALHRNDEAMAQIDSALTAHPDNLLVHRVASVIYIATQRYPQAEAQMRWIGESSGSGPVAGPLLVRGMADPGLRARAVQELETSPALAGTRKDAIVHALFLTRLAEHERALALLEGFAFNGDSTTPQLLWVPVFDPIRNDPRFKAVLKKMGLPYTPPVPTQMQERAVPATGESHRHFSGVRTVVLGSIQWIHPTPSTSPASCAATRTPSAAARV